MPSAVIAYGSRYCAPLKHLIRTYTSSSLFSHRRRHTVSVNFCSSFFHLTDPNLLTGNCLFFRMEMLYPCHHVTMPLAALILILTHSVFRAKAPCPFENSGITQFRTGSDINKNKAMVEQLQNYGVIRSKKVAEVMETIDRALFVPHGTPPYVDSPMQIGYNVTISAPHMHAMCLQLLEENLQPGMHALDVGSGTGYLTACFALMVGPQGRAVGLEHIPELVTSSVQNIEKSAAALLLKEGSLSVHVADGRLGWPEFAPYDAIHVGAAASEIPQPLMDQLKPGGRMVIPVGNIFQDLKVVDKNPDGSVSVRTETSVRYVPLTSREAQLRGY